MYWCLLSACTVVPLSKKLMIVLKKSFFTQIWFKPKIFYLKKCVNYSKPNLQQNSVKRPKDPNSERKKMTKYNIKF